MKIRSGILFLVALGMAACSLVQKVETTVSTVKDCANQVTHSVTLGILDDVSAVLVCDSGDAAALPACVVTQLSAIAAKAGWAAVDCALAEIQQKAAVNVNASGDSTETIRGRRAAAVADARSTGKVGPAP